MVNRKLNTGRNIGWKRNVGAGKTRLTRPWLTDVRFRWPDLICALNDSAWLAALFDCRCQKS
jgi:hypothetical protein